MTCVIHLEPSKGWDVIRSYNVSFGLYCFIVLVFFIFLSCFNNIDYIYLYLMTLFETTFRSNSKPLTIVHSLLFYSTY